MDNYNEHLGDFNEFITNNMRLVHKICWKYKKFIEFNPQLGTYEDMVSIGSIGLIKAYKNFNPNKGEGNDGKGIKFSTYGVPMIVGEIQRSIRDTSVGAKFSRSYKDAYFKMYTADMLEEEPKDIMEKLGMSEGEVERGLQYYRHYYPQYLDEEIFENDGEPLTRGDMTSSEEVDFDSSVSIEEFMSTLSPRHGSVLNLFRKEFTQMEIARKVGISQVQVSRILSKVFVQAEGFAKKDTSFSNKAG